MAKRYDTYKDSGVQWLGKNAVGIKTLVASHSYGWEMATKTTLPMP